jgi:hypothetical protein
MAQERGVYRARRHGTTKAKPRRAEELRDSGLTVQKIATALGGAAGRPLSITWRARPGGISLQRNTPFDCYRYPKDRAERTPPAGPNAA